MVSQTTEVVVILAGGGSGGSGGKGVGNLDCGGVKVIRSGVSSSTHGLRRGVAAAVT